MTSSGRLWISYAQKFAFKPANQIDTSNFCHLCAPKVAIYFEMCHHRISIFAHTSMIVHCIFTFTTSNKYSVCSALWVWLIQADFKDFQGCLWCIVNFHGCRNMSGCIQSWRFSRSWMNDMLHNFHVVFNLSKHPNDIFITEVRSRF